MSYQDEAATITPAKAEVLLRALDIIGDNDPQARPGQVGYMTKAQMAERARLALAAVRTPVRQDA